MRNVPKKSSWNIFVVGFSFLAAFFGVGIASISVAILACMFKKHGERLIAGTIPILVAGGVLGLVAGIVVAVRTLNSDPTTEQKLIKKYVGRGGRAQIYSGAPLFVITACMPLFVPLSQRFGDRIFLSVYFGFVAAVMAVSLFLYKRIPEKCIIPVGIIGWLLIVLVGFGFSLYMIQQPF